MNDDVRRFAQDTWTAGVIGLGYVGLPLATTASQAGLHVVGFDVSQERVVALNSGHSHVEDVTDEELSEALEAGAQFTTDEVVLAEADAIHDPRLNSAFCLADGCLASVTSGQ